MTRILYYLIIKPLSLLPYWVLYRLSDFLFIVFYYIIGYRKKVVKSNLQRIYKDESVIHKIEKSFYRHLCDVIVEGIKGFSISEAQLRKRYRPEAMLDLEEDFRKGRSVILSAAHYSNWEWATMALPLHFNHTCIGIYTPLSNSFLEEKMKKSRSRTGLVLLKKDEVKNYYKTSSQDDAPSAHIYLVDQSPSAPDRALWLDFLGVKTPVQFGAEKYSKERNLPVHYIHTSRVKRGYYTFKIKRIVDDPTSLDHGVTMKTIYANIEEMIQEKPSDWLWTHRRWKHCN